MIVLSSIIIFGFLIIQSARYEELLIPPKLMLFPKAKWNVPKTFSSSITLSIILALGSVSIPN